MRFSSKAWLATSLAYVLFFVWYTDLRGPLSETEVNRFIATMTANGLPQERVDYYAKFLREDTGREFIMVNALDKNQSPPPAAGAPPSADADTLLGLYMQHMWPELLKRACHPVIAGPAVYTVIDIHGIEQAERWTDGALMRYRSRRAFMEIISNPDILGPHEFKLAALEKTIAYPIETGINLGDPRLLLGLMLFSLALLIDKLGHLKLRGS